MVDSVPDRIAADVDMLERRGFELEVIRMAEDIIHDVPLHWEYLIVTQYRTTTVGDAPPTPASKPPRELGGFLGEKGTAPLLQRVIAWH